ncbi:MAG: hypothetical protein FJ012_09925 [Chloroflexi bacterium]|nr:hypothetical protein [Chloroflexota bacterium]
MNCTTTNNYISRTVCEPEYSNTFGADCPQPTCAPAGSKPDTFDGQIREQAPAMTEDDYGLVALGLLLVAGMWQITGSYLK